MAAGCGGGTSRYTATVGEVPPSAVGYRFTLELVDGTSVPARAEPTPVGHVWRAETGAFVDPRRIRVARRTSHLDGMLEGLWKGPLIGAAIGVALGLVFFGDPDGPEGSVTAADDAVPLGAYCGLVGLVLGPFEGGVEGRTYVFEYPVKRPLSAKARRPPSPPVRRGDPGQLGGSCTGGSCVPGLQCRDSVCVRIPGGQLGGRCFVSGRCADGLVCRQDYCRAPHE
jgi:hypothetical protein